MPFLAIQEGGSTDAVGLAMFSKRFTREDLAKLQLAVLGAWVEQMKTKDEEAVLDSLKLAAPESVCMPDFIRRPTYILHHPFLPTSYPWVT